MSLLMGFLYESDDREINVPCSERSPGTNTRHGQMKDLAGWGLGMEGEAAGVRGEGRGAGGGAGGRGHSRVDEGSRAGACSGKGCQRRAASDKERWSSFGGVSWGWRSSGVFWGSVGDGELESPLQEHPPQPPRAFPGSWQCLQVPQCQKPESESHSTTVGKEKVGMKERGGGCKGIAAVAAGEAACTAGAVPASPSRLVLHRWEEKPCKSTLALSLS